MPPLKEIAHIAIKLLIQYSRPSIQQNTYNHTHISNFVVSDDVTIDKTVCLQQLGKLKGIHYTKTLNRWRTTTTYTTTNRTIDNHPPPPRSFVLHSICCCCWG